MSEIAGRSAYTAEVRVLMCSNCGAPFDVPIHGGLVQCRFCAAQSEMSARVPAFASTQAERVPEPERLRLLRAQENRPMLPPQSIEQLFGPDFEIPAYRNQDAFAAWQSARKRTAIEDLQAAEELSFLNLVFGNQFLRANDWARHRAMLESALEAFFLARHRSVAAAELCLGACRQSDLAGAEAWLKMADPASDDLYADSEYRAARAGLSQLKGDYQGVLMVLGQTSSEIPIHDALDCSMAVTRANAWERLGQIDRATAELSSVMAKASSNRGTLEGIIESSGMCPQSFPRAIGALRQRAARASAAMTLGKLGMAAGVLTILAIVGGIFWAKSAGWSDESIGVFCLIGAFGGVTLLGVGAVLHRIGDAKRAAP